MMRLPKPNKEFKPPKVDSFITNNDGPKIFLTYFVDSLSRMKTNAYLFENDLPKEPFREFAWLFSWVTDQESTTYFP